ncbi:YfcC family protein [Virgibacillus natechei]
MTPEKIQPVLEPQEKKSKIPHTFVILFGVIILMAILSYVIPSGTFDRQSNDAGNTVVINGSYHETASSPAGILDIFQAIFEGMVQSSEIIFLLLVVGGSFGVLGKTGAIEGIFNRILLKMDGNEIYIIPVLMTFFAVCGATFGMAEESIPYLIILFPFLLKMGFDPIVAVATPLIGTSIGWAGSFTNPFNVGIAQGIAELPLFSGIMVRVGLLAILIVVASLYVMFYARKIVKDPNQSLMYKEGQAGVESEHDVQRQPFTKREVIILVIFAATVFTVPYGIIQYGWYMKEMAALFLIMGIVVGIVANMNYNDIADAFTSGCKDLLVAALAVGLAYGAVVILEDTNTLDTIINGLTSLIEHLPSSFAAVGMVGVQSAINYVISSGSGQAALTMPIMVPLADMLEVSRQTAVLAFQFGDGISNSLTPTNGYLMASLAIAGVSWFKWARFILPLIITNYIIGAIYVLIVHLFIWT